MTQAKITPITHGSPMPLSSTLPTYATLEPKIRAWATHRRIISPAGRPLLGTTQGQYQKIMEEIGEAELERRKLAKSKAMRLQLFPLGLIVEGEGVLDRRLDRIALEFGDVLVTLTILAAMHGVTLDSCRQKAPNHRLSTWQFVGDWALGLKTSFDYAASLNIANTSLFAEIGTVARCVEDEARILLELSGPECLALALAKIEGRNGAMVDGVFVKAVTVGP